MGGSRECRGMFRSPSARNGESGVVLTVAWEGCQVEFFAVFEMSLAFFVIRDLRPVGSPPPPLTDARGATHPYLLAAAWTTYLPVSAAASASRMEDSSSTIRMCGAEAGIAWPRAYPVSERNPPMQDRQRTTDHGQRANLNAKT